MTFSGPTRFAFFCLFFAAESVNAGAADAPKVHPLWPDGVAGSKGDDPSKDVPTLTVYPAPADKASGAAVVICPGGGYGMLAVDHEGDQVARWLNGVGVTGVVLKYRLGPRYHHPAMIDDANRAVRTVRARAKEWGVDPTKIGVLGFSAGGHLASTAATHFDAGKADAKDPVERVSSRPDRAILVYPVISLTAPFSHGGLEAQPAGREPARRAPEIPLQRDPGDARDAPHVPRPYRRG